MAIHRRPRFSFLIHPRSVTDFDRIPAFRVLKRYSASDAEFVEKTRAQTPLFLGEVNFGVTPFYGELIGVSRLPEDLVGAAGASYVADAAAVAVARGAPVIGLGALTAPATGGGMRLLRRLPPGVTLTNGNGFTAAVVRENVHEALASFRFGARRPVVGILGCTGSVGTPAARLLADDGLDLILVGRSRTRVAHKFSDIPNAVFADGLDALAEADVTVILTSDPSAAVSPQHVGAGSIVIDCAQPANVSPQAADDFQRRGVRVYEGGAVRIPGYSTSVDLGFDDPRDTFACLAETYLFARHGLCDPSTGAPSVAHSRRMARMAADAGIAICPLRQVSRPKANSASSEVGLHRATTAALGEEREQAGIVA